MDVPHWVVLAMKCLAKCKVNVLYVYFHYVFVYWQGCLVPPVSVYTIECYPFSVPPVLVYTIE